jgi:CheY-like chemotaxis protein
MLSIFLASPKPYWLAEARIGGIMRRRPSILIVDDEIPILQLCEDALSGEYEVHTTPDLGEAVQILHKHKIDLLMVDMVMPQGDGIEFIKRVRMFPDYDHIPIIAISAFPDLAARVRQSGSRVDAILSKPFRLSELSRIVAAAIHALDDGPHNLQA